jgi:hypothetical protein
MSSFHEVRVEPGDPTCLVRHLEAAADVQRRGRQHAPALDDRELGRAAAHVDFQEPLAGFMAHPCRA